jgi:sensor histidine kinase regulating citrate/malate metabolism
MEKREDTLAQRAKKVEEARFSIVLWSTVFLIFFLLSIVGVFIIATILQVNSVTEVISSRLLVPVMTKALEVVDGDEFKKFLGNMDDTSNYYLETQRILAEIKAGSHATYLYTMAPVNGNWRGFDFEYIIDGSFFLEELEEKGDEFSYLGDQVEISSYEAAFFEAIRTKQYHAGSIEQNEYWGSIVSVYAPILDSDNELVGILGCDLKVEDLILWVRSLFRSEGALVLSLAVVGLLLYLYLIRKVNVFFRSHTG